MLRRDILAEFGISKDDVDRETDLAFQSLSSEMLERELDESVRDYTVNTVLEGRIVNVTDDDVMVDVGYKSEGAVPKWEWDDPSLIELGSTVEVLLEAVEDDAGVVQLSKRKADRIRSWQRIVTIHDEGDIVTGRVMRKIKGGLLLDVGVPVFLPASQVDIRRPAEIADYRGQRLTCKILKIDEERRNIVVSRRQLIESQRQIMQNRLFPMFVEGEIRRGKVKNIVDFGAFVDLGGVDGLLHITDMSWGRISHPSEIVAIDDDIEVKILNVDQKKGKVALGLKQKTPSPWANVAQKYPVGTIVRGEVVNLMSYGAFVKLEEGVEGLVHISEMSWTQRINHPSEVVAIGDAADVAVLAIDGEKEQISLGMKQTDPDPWEAVQRNYPPGTKVVGRVRNLTSYGAFVEIEEGIDGLLHVSDMSWTRKVSHPSEVLKKGETIETMVLEVDPEKRRVALGLKQLQTDPWQDDIPQRYRPGDLVRGVVSKLTSFGAFVTLEDGLEGLLHISELSDKKISSPEEILAVGDVVDVLVLRVEPESRKIGLSMRTDTVAAGEGAKPGLVIRSDQIAAAEDPKQIVQQALEQAQQRDGADVEGPQATPADAPEGEAEHGEVEGSQATPADAPEGEAEPLPSEGEVEHGEVEGPQATPADAPEGEAEPLPSEGEVEHGEVEGPQATPADAPEGEAEPLPSEGEVEHGEAVQQTPETPEPEVQQEPPPPTGEDSQEPEDTTGDATPPST